METKNDLEGQDPLPNDPADGGEPNEPAEDGAPADAPEDVEALKARLNSAEGHIADLKKTAGVNSVKELKQKLSPPKPEGKPPAAAKEQGEYVTREEIALLNRGYSPEEIDIARRIAPGKSLAEAVADDVAKAAIEGIRAKKQKDDSVPAPSNRIPIAQNKTFNELKPQEKQRHYAQAMDSLIQKGRQSGPRSPGR